MLLGKRPRPPIKRTTSMTGITVDSSYVEGPEPSDATGQKPVHAAAGGEGSMNVGYGGSFSAMVSPRPHRRGSNDFLETPHFLRSCGLCKRRLAPGRDIYMYRGDTAFCSLECREQQMKQDERKEKMGGVVGSKKEDHHASSSTSKASSKSETVAAA